LNLGVAAADTGDYDRAAGIFEAALALGRELGDWFAISRNLYNLAATHMRQGRLQQAVELCSEALEICHEHGDSAGIATCFEVLAAISTSGTDAHRAARLLGAAEALRERIHAPLTAEVERRLRDSAVVKAREMLGDRAYESEENTGRTTNPSEIIVYALEVPVGV
jgi:non-specific serine/threonine protein kinase